MTDRLTLTEVQEALQNGVGLIYKTIRCVGEDGADIILQNPQIRMGSGHSITFSSGDIMVEKFLGTDTEIINGVEVFKNRFVLQELSLQGGRRSRKKSRKVIRKRNRKASRKERKSRKH